MKDDKSAQPKLASSIPLPKSKRGIKGFYKDVVREMKHVTWPTRHEATRLTGVVLAVCALIAVMLLVLSLVFDVAFRILFRGGL